MKTRITALLIALLMLVTLTACGEGEELSAYESYIAAAEKFNEAGSMEVDMDMDITMAYEGESMDISAAFNMKIVNRSEADADFSMVGSMAMMGMTLDMGMTYVDGVYYMDILGQKMKAAYSMEDAAGQVNTEAIHFDETAVKEFSSVEKDGGQEIQFTLDGAALSDMLGEMLSSTTDSLGEDLSYQYGDVTMSAFIDKDGVLKSTDISLSMDMTMEGETIPADATIHMDFLGTGADVTVEAPADADAYTEVDPSTFDSLGI